MDDPEVAIRQMRLAAEVLELRERLKAVELRTSAAFLTGATPAYCPACVAAAQAEAYGKVEKCRGCGKETSA